MATRLNRLRLSGTCAGLPEAGATLDVKSED